MDNKNIVKIKDNEGNDMNIEVLVSFKSNETNKEYAIYTPTGDETSEKVEIFGSIVSDGPDGKVFEKVTDSRDIEIIKRVITKMNTEG